MTASLIVGYSSSNKKINHMVIVGFSTMTALTVFLILDLDRPRRGYINTSPAQQKIVELMYLFRD